jgi:4'-phosphopantetheinyl transferase
MKQLFLFRHEGARMAFVLFLYPADVIAQGVGTSSSGQHTLGPGGVVVAATTAEVLAAVPAAHGLLTGAEQDRADAFRFDRDRDDFVAAHVLARACASAVVGLPAGGLTWQQRCPECGGAHGRPSVAEAPGLGLSLAHASGYVAAAAANGPVGVDVETVRPGSTDRSLAPDVLTEAEVRLIEAAPDGDVAFLRQWVRREALVKVGALTLDTLKTVDLSHLPPGEPADGWATHAWEGLVLADWRLGPALGAVAAHDPVSLRSLASVLP